MFADCALVDGSYPPESSWEGPYLWTRQRFVLQPARSARFARLRLCYLGQHGTLSLSGPHGPIDEVELAFGWRDYVVSLEGSAGDAVTAVIGPLVPIAGESRELGVMLRDIALFDDQRLFEMLSQVAANSVLNEEEFRAGCTVLSSYPTAIRVTIETRCNIPETSQACVYCAWNWAKSQERGSPHFSLDTLSDLGDFYNCATNVHDCSIGEPTMHKQFGPLVAAHHNDGKLFSFTTNGQLLGERRRRDILGKNVTLYVSLDAATAAGFARYRNERFDDIITNLRALCREKRQHGNRPTLFVSFIAMRSNVAELPEYMDLMSELGVDEVKLRAFYLDDNVNAPVVVNNGYRFDYAAEVLSMVELTQVGASARQMALQRGVPLYVEWDEFAREEQTLPGAPICSEPWKTLYMLRRGIMPCCYATEPLARWEEQGDRPLDQFLGDVFNGPAFQEIRTELAAGRLAEFCRKTPSCPVLKRLAHGGQVAGLVEPTYAPRAVSAAAATLPFVPLESLMLPQMAQPV